MAKIRRKGERGGEATYPQLEAPLADIPADVTKIDKPKPATRKAKARKVSR